MVLTKVGGRGQLRTSLGRPSSEVVSGLTKPLRWMYRRWRYRGGATTGAGRGQGTRRGRRVDNDMSRLIQDIIEGRSTTRRRVGHTHALLAALEDAKIIPVRTQVAVYDSRINIATAADLLCTYGDHLAMVEIKTGFTGYLDDGQHPMEHPYEDLRDSPRNQHFLQAAFTTDMLQHACPRVGPILPLVARVDATGVVIERVPASIMAKLPAARTAIRNARHRR